MICFRRGGYPVGAKDKPDLFALFLTDLYGIIPIFFKVAVYHKAEVTGGWTGEYQNWHPTLPDEDYGGGVIMKSGEFTLNGGHFYSACTARAYGSSFGLSISCNYAAVKLYRRRR